MFIESEATGRNWSEFSGRNRRCADSGEKVLRVSKDSESQELPMALISETPRKIEQIYLLYIHILYIYTYLFVYLSNYWFIYFCARCFPWCSFSIFFGHYYAQQHSTRASNGWAPLPSPPHICASALTQRPCVGGCRGSHVAWWWSQLTRPGQHLNCKNGDVPWVKLI